jgi:sugar phosphate isomerase/epimerase
MESLKRREFLGLALALATFLEGSEREPRAKFPTEQRERLAVSTYPFRRVIAASHGENNAPGGMTLEQFAQTIAPKFNVPGIEPWSHHFKSTDPAYVHGLRSAFTDAGVHVVNIPVDVRVNLCGNQEDRESGLAIYRKWVDAAATLGSPSIRVHLPRGEKDGQIDCAVSALKALADYGASKNVVINIENDNRETEQPERIVRVLKTVNSPFLRALPDFCNSMLIHDDQNYNNQALALLFPLAFNVSHVKDTEQDAHKNYHVNVDQIFAIAKKAGYRGYFSMEWEGTGDEYEGTSKLIEASLRNLG